MRRLMSVLSMLAVLATVPAEAAMIDAVDSGWYTATGTHFSPIENYIVGDLSGTEYRNFVVFDLTTVTEVILSAEIQLYNPDNAVSALRGYISPDANETIALYDVTTAADTVRMSQTGAAGMAIFSDLGSGTLLGERIVSAADNGSTISIALNSDGLAALNAARGGLLAIGGALTSLGASGDEYVFAFSQSIGNPELRVLQLRTAVAPEPAMLSLLGLGVLVAASRRYGRN